MICSQYFSSDNIVGYYIIYAVYAGLYLAKNPPRALVSALGATLLRSVPESFSEMLAPGHHTVVRGTEASVGAVTRGWLAPGRVYDDD